MKNRYPLFAILGIAVLAVAILFNIDAASAAPMIAMPQGGDVSSFLYAASPVLLSLRSEHADLVKRAADKFAEIKDGLAPEALRGIENEHADLISRAAAVDVKIKAEEQRIADAPPATDPVAVERTRSAEIIEVALRHGMADDFAQRHIAAGTTIDQVRSEVLSEVAKRSAAPKISTRVQVITDEGDTMRDAVETAILHRANPRAATMTDAARQWRGMTLLEMGRAFIEESTGERVRGLGKFELASRILGLDTGLRAGGLMSTSDFPIILANVVSKRLRNAYEVAPQNWKRISRQNNAPDFKTRAITQLSNLPNFKKITEGGEYTRAALADSKEEYALLTYGRVVGITRQTIINDDLGAFDRIPTLLGRSAAETEASLFWSIFTSNPAMSDTNTLFHANHKNIGTAAAISVASLSEGRSLMRKQTGFAAKAADAEPLNLSPKFILVSPDKETEAQQFLATIGAVDGAKVNPFANSLEQITEARLSGNAWYLVADPATVDTIEYAYLEGEEGLFTEQRLGFDVDGLEIKGRLDFAAKPIDWRGMVKNAGN